jgi:nicotinate-nucleotide adenylyltransferase
MRPLAILGGTFDPIHLGHLCVAWEAAEALDAETSLVPAHVPPHRPAPRATAAERVALIKAALAGQRRLRLDTRELEREGPSYSVDTLTELRGEIGPDRPLVLLVGADAFARLPQWSRWREIFGLAHIGVLTRPGELPPLDDELADEIAPRRTRVLAGPAGQVIPITVTALDISATAIREILAAGRMPRYLLPAGVVDQPGLLAPYTRALGSP